MTLTVTILKGLIASGKTTWCKELQDKHPHRYLRISKDDLRMMLDNSHYSSHSEQRIIEARNDLILLGLSQDKHILIDDTNLNPVHEETIRQLVKLESLDREIIVQVKEFDVDVDECIKRDLARPNSVGPDVIRKMYSQYLKPKVAVIEYDRNLLHVVIYDIDGSIAKMNNRGPFEFDKCDTDLPIIPVIQQLEIYLQSKKPKPGPNVGSNVIFISGREDSCRDKTLAWLQKHIQMDEYQYMLFMRKTGDKRKDTIVKQEIFEEHIKDKYYVEYVIDDRPSVIRMWKELGLFVFNVGDGNEF